MNKVRFEVLTEAECRGIVEVGFRLLEETGCDVYHEGARKILADAGCTVDGLRVKIPPDLIKKAMETVPSTVEIYDREGNPALTLNARSGGNYFVAGFENQYRLDLETGEKRLTTKQDAVEAGLVVDALDNIDVASGLCCISDCTPMLASVYETRLLLETTSKPHHIWNFDTDNLKTQVEMCAVVAGGMDKFLEKPFVIADAGAIPPLTHAEDAMDKLLCMFELGLPTGYWSCPIIGGTSPKTFAGALAMAMADTFLALLLSQLVKKGTPFLATVTMAYMDMRFMNTCQTSPEAVLCNAAQADIFRYLDIPFTSWFGATDSPVFDEQAAADISTQVYTGLLSGSNLNYFVGFLESAMSSSLEALVLGNEVIDMYRHFCKGIEVNEETLAEKAMANVGPGGNFFGEDHTMRHCREGWNPSTFIRESHEKWVANGKRDFHDRAKEKVRAIIEKGVTKPLTAETLARLDEIVRKAEERRVRK